MKTALILAATGMVAAQLSAATVDWSKLPPAATVTGVTFDKDIQPMFKASCVRCHGAERPKAQLRLDSLRRRFERHQAGADSHCRRQRQQFARQSRFATGSRNRHAAQTARPARSRRSARHERPGNATARRWADGRRPRRWRTAAHGRRWRSWSWRPTPRRSARHQRFGNAPAQFRPARQAADRRTGRSGPRLD